MELRRFVAIVWHRLWVIVMAPILVTMMTYALSVTLTPIYQATTTLEINYGADPRNDAYSSLLVGERAAKTYVEQLRSPQLARDVTKGLGLDLPPASLLGMISAEQVRETQIIRISADSTNSGLAQAVANKAGEIFINQTTAKQETRFQSAKQDLDIRIADLAKQIANTQKAIASLGDPGDARNANIPEFTRVERSRLESSLSSDQTRYVILLTSAEDLRLAQARYSDNIRVLSPADLPSSPVQPRTTLYVLLGLIGGLVLGVSVAFLLEYVDDTVRGPEQIVSALGLTVLGIISRLNGLKEPKDALVVATNPKSPIAEAYRVLRTNFQFSGLSNPHASVVVASPGPKEGKTTTLANLGAILAHAGKKVILVDANLRSPMLHRLFEVSREPGLTTLLLRPDLGLDHVLLKTKVDGLRILPSGPLSPNPAEILSSPHMGQIVSDLKEQADVVLYDSPPVLLVADAILLAAAAGNVVIVAAAGETRTGALAQARDALRRTQTRILGVAVNKFEGRRRDYYCNHSYGS